MYMYSSLSKEIRIVKRLEIYITCIFNQRFSPFMTWFEEFVLLHMKKKSSFVHQLPWDHILPVTITVN